MLVVGLVAGSHAFHGGFATLCWQAAGLAPQIIGLLRAVAVAAEAAMNDKLG